MAHQFWQLYVHVVWSTKNRSNILRNQLELVVHDAIRDTVRELEMIPICVNSAWNHTHSLISWNPTVSVENGIEKIKNQSVEKWNQTRHDKGLWEPKLEWQRGWAAFSVSPGKVEFAKSYVANQKSLHLDGRIIERYETLKGELS